MPAIPPRLTRVQRDAYEGVRRIVAAPLDTVRLRQEVAARIAPAIPTDMSGLATSDPELGVLSHGLAWGYPADLLHRYYTHVYPVETATDFIDRARSGQLVSSRPGPVETEFLREGGLGPKLRIAIAEHGVLWGAWCMSRQQDATPFTEEEEGLVALVAPLVAGGLRRAALFEAADAPYDDAPEAPSMVPGVVVYDARGRLVLRDGRAARHMADLDDVGCVAHMPAAIAGALARLRWRLRDADQPGDPGADVRTRGRSGQWYSIHASAAESDDPMRAGQTVVVLTPLGGGERAGILARLYGLTSREREVVVRLAHGESGKQIAAALGLSAHTVQAHIDNACARLGVRGRRELVARLFVDASAARLAS